MEVENEIQFTHVIKVFVQDFHKIMNRFQRQQLVIVLIHNGNEVKRGISNYVHLL